MGAGAATMDPNGWYTLQEVKDIIGDQWTDDMQKRFDEEALFRIIDGKHDSTLVVSGERFFLELKLRKEYTAPVLARKSTTWTDDPKGASSLSFSESELHNPSQCEEANTEIGFFKRSPAAFDILSYLTELPKIHHCLDHADPMLQIYKEDPAPKLLAICHDYHQLFIDEEFPPGPSLATPCNPNHDNQYTDLHTLRHFNRLPYIYGKGMKVFDETDTQIWDNIIQNEKHSGICSCTAAIGAIACIYRGSFMKTLLSELNIYGVYSLKVFVSTPDPSGKMNEDGTPALITVPGWVLVDDFVPCREGDGTPLFSTCREGAHIVWPHLVEKCIAKIYGASTGGYTQILRRPYYAGEIMQMLTGLEPREYNLTVSKEWKTVAKLLRQDVKCRIGAATVTKPHLSKVNANGIVSGIEHAYAVIDAVELKDKYNKTIQLLRLRNTWGESEWQGAWSDHSKEFKQYKHELHDTRCADDGAFWMCKDDFLKRFQGLYGVQAPVSWQHKPLTRAESDAASVCGTPPDEDYYRHETVSQADIMDALKEANLLGDDDAVASN